MANNVSITQGVGTVIATDQNSGSGAHYQAFKIADGTAGSTTLIPGDATSGLWVQVKSLPALPAGTNALGTVTSVGNVASAAADSGFPVKVAGVFHTVAPTIADGQRADLQVDANGFLKVNLAAGAGAGGTSIADKSAFTTGTTAGTPAQGLFQTSPDTVSNGTIAALGIDTNRNVKVVGSIGSGAADSGSPVKVGAKYNATFPSFADGQRGDLQIDSSGNLKVTLATLVAGEDLTNNVLKTENQFSYAHINSLATTTVKSGAGFLHRISINTKGASANIATIYDNTAGSGTVIGVLDTTAGVTSLEFNIKFATGLTIVTATGTAGDLTIAYR